jgi:hypothetical protein
LCHPDGSDFAAQFGALTDPGTSILGCQTLSLVSSYKTSVGIKEIRKIEPTAHSKQGYTLIIF